MARADDPRVMVRNPALLSDLWGSIIYLAGNIEFPRACFLPSGGYGWGTSNRDVVLLDPDEGPLYPGASEGSSGGIRGEEPVALTGYAYEPYPDVCYRRGPKGTPAIGYTARLGDRLGVGVGFMPPEDVVLTQWGNPDGTVDTPDGKRPNPARYMDTFRYLTYFDLLFAAGYRVLPWLRLGVGARWGMWITDTTIWDNASPHGLDPSTDIRGDFYGRDLFIPGFTVSAHAVPVDSLDIAVGFSWQDRVRIREGKLDMTVAPFGPGGPFVYRPPDGGPETLGVSAPYTNHNVPVSYEGPPPAVPQLSFGIRFADRIRPRPGGNDGFRLSTGPVRDSMVDERWDIEFNAVYYLNSVADRQRFAFAAGQSINGVEVLPSGDSGLVLPFLPAACPDRDGDGEPDVAGDGGCESGSAIVHEYGGVDQLSLRLGGDYNVLPGVLALRTGVSYENRGQQPGYARPTLGYPFRRLGLHFGFTWRIDGRTDATIGFAHFFQETVRLTINEGADGRYGLPEEFGREGDRTLSEAEVRDRYRVISADEADGVARQLRSPGGYALNAGSHWMTLNVLGGSVQRHF
jgi:hypothetical protein